MTVLILDLLFQAASGFEPENEGFADLCLTTWLCRRNGVELKGVKIAKGKGLVNAIDRRVGL